MNKPKPFLESWPSVESLVLRGYSQSAMAEELGMSRSGIRSIISRAKSKGLYTERLKKTSLEQSHGGNWSHGWVKTKNDDGTSTSVFIRNDEISKEDLDKTLKEALESFNAPKWEYNKPKKGSHCLVLDPADVHIGKLCSAVETGDSYDIEIAKKRIIEGVKGILQKASGFNIDTYVVVIGNDVLHIDNKNRTTTAGTPQDTDGTWHGAFIAARDVFVQIIQELAMNAKVDVIFNPSNHDFMSGYMFAQVLEAWFQTHENVSFNATIRDRKYYKYGKNLIMTSHGDGAKARDLPQIIAHEAAKMWYECPFRYAYQHHIHHKQQIKYQSGKDYIGLTVEWLRSPSGTDAWHARKGYVGVPKAIEAFIHHKDHGQVARLTHIF